MSRPGWMALLLFPALFSGAAMGQDCATRLHPDTAAGAAPTAFVPDCGAFGSEVEIRRCLNEFARSRLAPGSPADMRFKERFGRLLARYDLRPEQIKSKPLASNFNILVEPDCFDFTGLAPRARERLASQVQQQIHEASLFLADVHASSFGHQVSLLFPIREVSLCRESRDNPRSLVFTQRSLRLNLGSRVLGAGEILRQWNTGNPIRSTEFTGAERLPWLGERLRRWKQRLRSDLDGLVRDGVAENWLVLNPIGELRSTAVYILAEAVFKIGSGASDQADPGENALGRRARLLDVMRGPGFSTEQRERVTAMSDADIDGLHSLWRQKLFSPENILSVMENAIGEQARQDNIHLTLRRLSGGVVVVNDHNISVRLEQLMSTSIPVSRFSEDAQSGSTIDFTRTGANGETVRFKVDHVNPRDLTLNADQVSGGVVVNTIDNVIVTVQVPRISPATYRRVSLHLALEEFVPAALAPPR